MIYTEKDLIEFGNYLLSEKRMENMSSIEARGDVHDADLANWKESNGQAKS